MEDRDCGHFISLSLFQRGIIALVLMNSPANSVSEAEDMTMFIIQDRDRIGPLLQGIGSLSEHKMCDPARLRARVLLRYAALDCAAKIILLDM